MIPESNTSEPGARPPLIWLVIGDKLGDNAQVEIIAEALGWPCERKQLYFLAPYVLGKPPFKASLYHVDTSRSAVLEPPWPDLVITIGRRPAMAALWIREQSGGHTQIVLLGRPKRWLEKFALVIATPQYLLPDRPNVLPIDLPLMRSNTAAVTAAAAAWQSRLAVLPRPLIAVLVGGQTKPFIFDSKVAAQLLAQLGRAALETGGTLYLTTSRRTPRAVVETLQAGLPPGAILYRWQANDPANPYLALLGLADRFVVSGDSISMLVEVARLGKPLAIFPLPYKRAVMGRLGNALSRLIQPSTAGRRAPLQALGDGLYRLGLIGYSRDLTAVHELLIQRGLAVRLGDPFPPPGPPLVDDLSQVGKRIKALLPGAT
ncbi:MAG TPA: ELM1/GtrOC1 family putative glycosyltransferase [Candidatus Competibacteraceae bacterium]|nr:ELM1/GtrOC1 family putative glycosyltransferase [Candidatus Competibacteraceae bacterium]